MMKNSSKKDFRKVFFLLPTKKVLKLRQRKKRAENTNMYRFLAESGSDLFSPEMLLFASSLQILFGF